MTTPDKENSAVETGGPAFPSMSLSDSSVPNLACKASGMTLRDYFAAKALEGLLSGIESEHHSKITGKLYSEIAYEVADAMLAARKQGD